jgi:hypothetical protein
MHGPDAHCGRVQEGRDRSYREGHEARPVCRRDSLEGGKGIFAWCETREDDFANPARSIRKPAKEKSRDRVLVDTELKLTWEAGDAAGGAACTGS